MFLPIALTIWQVLLFLFYGIFTSYETKISGNVTSDELSKDTIRTFYPMFQDVHIMIFVGFGFLMTFLKEHRFGSVALNFLLGALSLQTGILLAHLFHCLLTGHWVILYLSIKNLILGDFSAGAVLISLGAALGKISPSQALLMTFLELVFFSLNEAIAVVFYQSVDMGGSMVVHTFGSFFGLAVVYILNKQNKEIHPQNTSTYNSDLIAMIGTLFLWAYWPSFNGAMASGNSQHRVIINTVMGLTASCVSAFAVSYLVNKRFNPEDILNATLAGGVAIGSSSDLVVASFVSLIVGSLAGGLSVLGFEYLSPLLKKKYGIHDTCGVNNLHGLPGVLGGLIGAISASSAAKQIYGDSIYNIFPAMGDGRTAGQQGLFQLACLITSVGIALVGGLFTGWVCQLLPEIKYQFKDIGWIEEDSEDNSNESNAIEYDADESNDGDSIA